MTLEEAIRHLDTYSSINGSGQTTQEQHEEAKRMAIDALKKQIPMKPITSNQPRYGMGYEYYDWFCPTCSRFLAFDAQISNRPPICKCGQKILWEDDDADNG